MAIDIFPVQIIDDGHIYLPPFEQCTIQQARSLIRDLSTDVKAQFTNRQPGDMRSQKRILYDRAREYVNAFNRGQLAAQPQPAPSAPSYDDVMAEAQLGDVSSPPAYLDPMTDSQWMLFANDLASAAERVSIQPESDLPPAYEDVVHDNRGDGSAWLNVYRSGMILLTIIACFTLVWSRYIYVDNHGRLNICLGGFVFGLPQSWHEFMHMLGLWYNYF